MKIGTWNVRSITGKEEELVEEMEKQQIEILGITETKKKGNGMKRIHKGYWIFWSGVKETEGARGGVGLIIKPTRLKDIINEEYISERLLRIEMKLLREETWNVIIAYGENDDARKEEKDKFFEEVQKAIDDGGESILVMGDLNGRVGKQNEGIEEYLGKEGETTKNNNGDRIIEISIENNLVIANTKFRHKDIHKYTRAVDSRNEKSIIDYFLISKPKWKNVQDVKVTRLAEIGSDHYLVKMDLKSKKEEKTDRRRKKTKENIKTYKLKEPEYQRRYMEILNGKFREEEDIKEIEGKWENFKDNLLNAAMETCGKRKIVNKSMKNTEWWNADIKTKIKEKKYAWERYLNTKKTEDYEEYKVKRIEVKKVIKKAKEESWIKFGEKMTEHFRENQKLFYGTLKQLRKKREYNMMNIKGKDGNIITEEDQIMERWRQYFEELTKAETNITEEQEEIDKGEEIEEIQEKEVREAIQKIKIGKAPGRDKITPEMIKYMGKEGITKFTELLNEIMKSTVIPREWNAGIILPIYKKGDKRVCENYRGITLMSVPAKVFARIIDKRIRNRIENTIEETQCGFRKGRSAQDLIFTIRQVSEKLISKGREIHMCFIDLEKAFDRIQREQIWKALEKRMIDRRTIEILKAMYRNNTNIVRTNNEESREFVTEIGVKQGCVLSPLLFSIVIDEAIKNAKKKMKTLKLGHWQMEQTEINELMFADDMAIVTDSEKNLQYNLEVLEKELQKINMKINIGKTKSMIVSRENKTHSIKLQGKQIEQVESFKYLGSIIENNGKIDKEINDRMGKTGRIYNMLKSTFLGKKEVPTKIKTEVVKKVVRPTIMYSSETWTLTEKHKSRLNAMEMRFLRRIENKTKKDRIRNDTYRHNLQMEPVTEKIGEGQLRWFGHVCRMPRDRITKRVYETRVPGKNKRGRPRKTWEEGIREEAASRGIRWKEIKQVAQDRKLWKEKCKTTWT